MPGDRRLLAHRRLGNLGSAVPYRRRSPGAHLNFALHESCGVLRGWHPKIHSREQRDDVAVSDADVVRPVHSCHTAQEEPHRQSHWKKPRGGPSAPQQRLWSASRRTASLHSNLLLSSLECGVLTSMCVVVCFCGACCESSVRAVREGRGRRRARLRRVWSHVHVFSDTAAPSRWSTPSCLVFFPVFLFICAIRFSRQSARMDFFVCMVMELRRRIKSEDIATNSG